MLETLILLLVLACLLVDGHHENNGQGHHQAQLHHRLLRDIGDQQLRLKDRQEPPPKLLKDCQ